MAVTLAKRSMEFASSCDRRSMRRCEYHARLAGVLSMKSRESVLRIRLLQKLHVFVAKTSPHLLMTWKNSTLLRNWRFRMRKKN